MEMRGDKPLDLETHWVQDEVTTANKSNTAQHEVNEEIITVHADDPEYTMLGKTQVQRHNTVEMTPGRCPPQEKRRRCEKFDRTSPGEVIVLDIDPQQTCVEKRRQEAKRQLLLDDVPSCLTASAPRGEHMTESRLLRTTSVLLARITPMVSAFLEPETKHQMGNRGHSPVLSQILGQRLYRCQVKQHISHWLSDQRPTRGPTIE